jgi:hypothetical protein
MLLNKQRRCKLVALAVLQCFAVQTVAAQTTTALARPSVSPIDNTTLQRILAELQSRARA